MDEDKILEEKLSKIIPTVCNIANPENDFPNSGPAIKLLKSKIAFYHIIILILREYHIANGRMAELPSTEFTEEECITDQGSGWVLTSKTDPS